MAVEHSVLSHSPAVSTADIPMNDTEMNKFGTSVSHITQGSPTKRYMPHDDLQSHDSTNELQKTDEYLEEQPSSATVRKGR
ncbi:unnamed protein product [Trichobilharzia regenti]|nr:unnamed protein product [Trichobilharzia regenti]